DHPDAAVEAVGDEEIAARRDFDPIGMIEQCRGWRAAVAREAVLAAAAREGANDPVFYGPNAVVEGVRDVEGAVRPEGDVRGAIEPGRGGGATVTCIPARDGCPAVLRDRLA